MARRASENGVVLPAVHGGVAAPFLLAVDSIFGSLGRRARVRRGARRARHICVHPGLTDDRTLALVAATLMLASPIIVIQGGVYLAYLFSLGLGLFFGAALLAGLRRQSRGCSSCPACTARVDPSDSSVRRGALGAPLFGTRPFISWRKWGRVWRAACWVGRRVRFPSSCSPSSTTIGSRAVSPQFPITAKDPLDTFGFGARRLMPIGQIFDYTIGRAVRRPDNIRSLPPFLVAGWLGAVGAIVRRLAPEAGPQHARAARARNLVPSRATSSSGETCSQVAPQLSRARSTISRSTYRPASSSRPCSLRHGATGGASRSRCALVLAVATIPYLVFDDRSNHKISTAQEPWKDARTRRSATALWSSSRTPARISCT